jgi:uncharacterized protein YjdB
MLHYPYSDGATANITFQVNWLSSDPKIINIVPDDIGFTGKATAESPGIIHITASMNGITSQVVNVKSVEPVSLVSIAISPSLPTNLVQGGSQQFTAIGTYANGTTEDMTSKVLWSSSDIKVATIDSNGLVTGVGIGTTDITATGYNFYLDDEVHSMVTTITVALH